MWWPHVAIQHIYSTVHATRILLFSCPIYQWFFCKLNLTLDLDSYSFSGKLRIKKKGFSVLLNLWILFKEESCFYKKVKYESLLETYLNTWKVFLILPIMVWTQKKKRIYFNIDIQCKMVASFVMSCVLQGVQ